MYYCYINRNWVAMWYFYLLHYHYLFCAVISYYQKKGRIQCLKERYLVIFRYFCVGHFASSCGSQKTWVACCSGATPARTESVPQVLLCPQERRHLQPLKQLWVSIFVDWILHEEFNKITSSSLYFFLSSVLREDGKKNPLQRAEFVSISDRNTPK